MTIFKKVVLMFGYFLLAIELLLLYLAYLAIVRWHSRAYRVDKDIWGLYQEERQPQITENNVTIIFSNRLSKGFQVIDRNGKTVKFPPASEFARASNQQAS